MKLYLSGPMTGIDNYNFPEFFRIAKLLRVQGHDVFSPAEYDLEKGWCVAEFPNHYPEAENPWLRCDRRNPQDCPDAFEHRYVATDEFDYEEALLHDIIEIGKRDAIVLMPGWEQSNGACTELAAALDMDKEVYIWEEEAGRPIFAPDFFVRQRGGAILARKLADLEAKRGAGIQCYSESATLPPPQYSKALPKNLRTPEQHEVMGVFMDLLWAATGDGGAKRASGTKPSWKVDPGHEGAIFSHLTKWKRGEKVDPDSGVHPLVHAAWRCLAIAARESADNGLIPAPPVGASLNYPED